ncbi:unnamed protein product, partial [Candidula unifasciata]
ESQETMEHFRSLGRSAFVIGYTGAVGKALVQELNKAKVFKKVVLIGRRNVSLDVGPEFEQKVMDFEKLDEHKDVFKDLDTGFCCLGTYRARDGLGEAEDGLSKMNLERVSIFKPAFLVCKRNERRIAEAIVKVVLTPMIYFFPTVMSVPVETVARAMVNNAVNLSNPSPVEIYENKQIHKLAH